MANKLSREELLKLVDEMEENGEIDINRFHEKAQLKSTQISHRQLSEDGIRLIDESEEKEIGATDKISGRCGSYIKDPDYNNLEQNFQRKLEEGCIPRDSVAMSDEESRNMHIEHYVTLENYRGEVAMGATEERGTTLAPVGDMERMAMFDGACGMKGHKKREPVNRFQHETDAALDKLKNLGIRDEKYGEVKLGLLGYREYLIGKEGLLDYKRFKSVLKKLVGYQGIGHNLSKEQRILSIESMCLRSNGEDEQFNEWIENISAVLVRRWETNYRRFPGESKHSKMDIPRRVKEFNVPNYIDRAIKYIEVYCEKNYSTLLENVNLYTPTERLVFAIITGLISLGYNAEQIIYAIIRPVLPERDYKQKSVKEFYGRSLKNEYYKSVILYVSDAMSDVRDDTIKTTARQLHSLLKNPTAELLDRPYETLMIPNCVELKQIMRKGRICNEIRSICQCIEYRFPEGLPERAQRRLRKVIEDFKTLVELSSEETEKIEHRLSHEKYDELNDYVRELINDKHLLNFSKREEVIRANCELPDRRSNFFLDANKQMEKFRICSEFIYGEPNC